ncbi:unnamed protein product [Porites lobata]|uniref:von Willebrand factor D and EGF domain-containing protein n=1 Tax=Porites lobata TaxID=104759 RepID=A0ABN8P0S5_9CNID|nr:unnamed protein product [Porites lobata]
MACSWPRFKTVLLLSLLTIPKLSKPCIRILPEEGGWKQMSVGERAKLVKVVFIGKVINLYTVDKLSGTYAADFEIWRILKGRKIVDEVFEMHRSSLVKVYGFGEKRLCYSPVKPGDVHMVFMVYEPASRSLVARYDDIFGATAAPTAANENEVLQALGWKPWSSWSKCSKNCDGGKQTRTRACSVKECDGRTRQTRSCNTYECDGLKDIVRHVREEQTPPASKNENIHLKNGRMPSIDVSKVFRYYFPGEFSIIMTFRATKITNVYLLAMYSYRKIMTLGVRLTPKMLSFERNSLSLNHRWSLDFPVETRKGQWYSLGISVQEKEVTVYWNCEKIGTRSFLQKLSFIPDSLGKIYLGKPLLVSSIESYEIDVSEMYFVPDPGASKQQCDIPVFKPVSYGEDEEGSAGGGTPNIVDHPQNEVEMSWTEWSKCSRSCGKGTRKRVMMCDLESSYTDENGMPTDECLKALQNEEVKECFLTICPAQCDRPCLNGGFCASRNHCQCRSGFHGDQCEKVECKILCRNGGTCVGPYKCSCPPGYGGTQCEKALCSPPCQFGGRCVRPNVCHCSPGFLAPYCRPSCNPTCLNGGVCVGPNKCRCPKGYTGNNCLQAVCGQPCMNGGVCYKPDKCTCRHGWQGKRCEKAVCNPKCQNGGTCIRRNRCSCTRGYSGFFCQIGVVSIK